MGSRYHPDEEYYLMSVDDIESIIRLLSGEASYSEYIL